MEPGLFSTPETTRSASTRVVLPAADGPTSTTLRMATGLSIVGAAPVAWAVFVLPAMTSLLQSQGFACPPDAVVLLSHDSPKTRRTQDIVSSRRRSSMRYAYALRAQRPLQVGLHRLQLLAPVGPAV